MTKPYLSPEDEECLAIGRNMKLAGLRLAVSVLQKQISQMEPPNGAAEIRPAMRRTLAEAGIKLPGLPAPEKPKRRRKGPRSSVGIKGYWARMSPEERSAEMMQRRARGLGRQPKKPLVQPNHPRNLDHPNHAKWVATMRKANRNSWKKLTPEQRQRRVEASLAGKGLVPKVKIETKETR